MTPLRYNYCSDVDEETREILQAGKMNPRFPLREVSVEPKALAPDGTDWLHCVGAYRKGNRAYIRIISHNRGMNVVVPLLPDTADIMVAKLADLRFQVRNCECVFITFPQITIRSGRQGELYLLAYDFKLYKNS